MRRLAMLTLLALGACTPHQIQVWQDWHDRNPRAADAVRPTTGAPACAPATGSTSNSRTRD